MLAMRSLMIGLAQSVIWPSYLMVLAYVARLAPWPRGLARPLGFVLAVSAVALFVSNFLRWLFGPSGLASQMFNVPERVVKQLRRGRTLVLATAGLFLLPSQLLSQGLLAPAGQPLYAHTIDRLLILAFELSFLFAIYRVVRGKGELAVWLKGPENPIPWLGRHRRKITTALLSGTALLIALDTQGYGFTARRIAFALAETIALGVCLLFVERILQAFIVKNSWRWLKSGVVAMPPDNASGGLSDTPSTSSHDLSTRLKKVVHFAIPIVGLFIASWIWEFDLALFRYVTEQKIWTTGSGENMVTLVNVGDVLQAVLIFAVTGVLWRHLSTIFAVAVYPRMSDDPGVQFAVLTLCRYIVLGLGVLGGLSSMNLGLDKIGVVLAALGVGLGFGLQEIVSNFISGLILLVERPLRVGDIVTVANMTGKVDLINIRATTIINADNQSMIVPNREFITGNLINWTHKDKIIRVSMKIGVAYGTDPDRVSDLLLSIAREDPDVLGNPVAIAVMEEFSPSALLFSLHMYVPDPSVGGRVKHRIGGQIQKKFKANGISIPLPQQEVKIQAADLEAMISGLVAKPHVPPAPAQPPGQPMTPAPHLRIDRPPQSLIEA